MKEDMLQEFTEMARKSNTIDEGLYTQYDVKRGLRDKNKAGVLVGLTNIGQVNGYEVAQGKVTAIEGKLIYRGIEIRDLVKGFTKENRPGFDETIFLLLFGKLPTKNQLEEFSAEQAMLRELPHNFIENMIFKHRGKNIMNVLARCVLALYTLDKNADDISVKNLVKQSTELIAKFPTIIVYSYYALRHYFHHDNLIIRYPNPKLHTAENFLYMLKGDDYTKLEAELFDIVLVLHAEHGGGNNSSFTTHVVSSSGSDTYSVIASALGSLKGPLHGGANTKVIEMMDDIKTNVEDWTDEEEVFEYLKKILNKEAFDLTGKIYGFGHAVYTLSDPRAIILKEKAKDLAAEKGRLDEYALFDLVQRLTPKVFLKVKGSDKAICANVDFYSGFVYDCLRIPKELNTPLFAMSRISGWCAHRIEEIVSSKRIIRPAYKSVCPPCEYIVMSDRT